jgi:hypothetical protein
MSELQRLVHDFWAAKFQMSVSASFTWPGSSHSPIRDLDTYSEEERGHRCGFNLHSLVGGSPLPRHDLVTSEGTAVIIVRRGRVGERRVSYMPN